MKKPAKAGGATDFRRFFIRGLATLLPTVLTIVLLVKCFEFVQQNISVPLTKGVIATVVQVVDGYPRLTDEEIGAYLAENTLPPESAQDQKVLRRIRKAKLGEQWTRGPRAVAGFALAVVIVYIVGRLLASFLGRKLWKLFEVGVQQLPLFKQVYPYVKQVTDFLFGENKIEFSRVVAVPYPRKGIYSVGLVTGAGFRHITEQTQEKLLTIFIPSSPTPITGYVIYVREEEVIDLSITIEEALRFAVSGGVIVPEHQALARQLDELVPTSHGDEAGPEKPCSEPGKPVHKDKAG